MVPLLGATLIAKAVYYPISDFTGTNFCYFVIYTYYWVGIFAQSLTFFMTVFRYICLYHEQKLLRWHIKPKVNLSMYLIKKVMCILIFLINKGSCLLFLEFFPSLLTQVTILLSMIVGISYYFSIFLLPSLVIRVMRDYKIMIIFYVNFLTSYLKCQIGCITYQ